MSVGPLATVVLAAGAATRFGGGKLLAPLEGRPLLARVLGALDGVGERRVVVLGADADAVREAVPSPSWEAVVAAGWAAGPGASLRAGLGAVPEAASALIVLADLAWLRREAVDRVLDAAAAAPGAEAVRAVEAGRPGHPLLIRGAMLQRARQAPDEGLRPLLREAEVTAVECDGLGVARDVDTAADLGGTP